MKSVFFSLFLILVPWAVILILMINDDNKRGVRPSFASRHGGTHPCVVGVGAQNQSALPLIFAITPTYARPVQKAELTRLAHAFRQVPRFHWIVVEDSVSRTPLVTRFLAQCGVPFTHLNILSPQRSGPKGWPRGTRQRNAALTWLRQQHSRGEPGVVYFADDDNTYTLELFEEMRGTKRVSVWPVGFAGGRAYERPVVSRGKVVGWYTGYKPDRTFPIDMAGFAVNLRVILTNPEAQFREKPGMLENDFLNQITKVSELEPKANNCTQVLVWHTRTEKPSVVGEKRYKHIKDTVQVEV